MTTELDDNQIATEVLRPEVTTVASLTSGSLIIVDDGEGNLTLSSNVTSQGQPAYRPYKNIKTLRIDLSHATLFLGGDGYDGVGISSDFALYDEDNIDQKTEGVASAGSSYSGPLASYYTPQTTISSDSTGWGSNGVASWWEVTLPSPISVVRLYFTKTDAFVKWTTDYITLIITDEGGDQWSAVAPYPLGDSKNQIGSDFDVYLASLD